MTPAKRQFLAAWLIAVVVGATLAAANPTLFALIGLGLVLASGLALIPAWTDRD
jgi:hypothetical protein